MPLFTMTVTLLSDKKLYLMHRTFSHSRQAARSFQGKHPTAPYCQIEPGEIIFKDIIKYFLKQLDIFTVFTIEFQR